MNTHLDSNFSSGKYLVSPLTRHHDCGRYSAAVSIRRGQGSGTHDRIFFLMPRFATREQAMRYGTVHARRWLRLNGRP